MHQSCREESELPWENLEWEKIKVIFYFFRLLQQISIMFDMKK